MTETDRIEFDGGGAGFAAVERVRQFVSDSGLGAEGRLPPERELAPALGLKRSTLRQALAILESTGEVYRHVGRGTFVGHKIGRPQHFADVTLVASLTNPFDVMDARLLLEPKAAALAALRAKQVDYAEMERLLREGRLETEPVMSQTRGDALHRAIATATQNPLIVALFDSLYRVRAATSWGRLTPSRMPPSRLERLWREHGEIIAAIRDRDAVEAQRLMRAHIEGVQRNLAEEEPSGELPE